MMLKEPRSLKITDEIGNYENVPDKDALCYLPGDFPRSLHPYVRRKVKISTRTVFMFELLSSYQKCKQTIK